MNLEDNHWLRLHTRSNFIFGTAFALSLVSPRRLQAADKNMTYWRTTICQAWTLLTIKTATS
ncbi:MAG: hypothetical protein ABWZ39_13700, partial [Pseudomonas caspiana]